MVVAVDVDKFSKVLSNLVSNALKYTPEGGHVNVALTLTETLPEKLAGAAPASRYLVVSVTDDGIGMSQEDVGRIFERYKRLTQSERSTIGTGIGLHYVKQLLLVHKGSIAAELPARGRHALHLRHSGRTKHSTTSPESRRRRRIHRRH